MLKCHQKRNFPSETTMHTKISLLTKLAHSKTDTIVVEVIDKFLHTERRRKTFWLGLKCLNVAIVNPSIQIPWTYKGISSLITWNFWNAFF